MKTEDYIRDLYSLQEQVVKIINDAETPFYLTGGTALSRGYLDHRFSDDLTFFVNDDSSFNLYVDRAINRFAAEATFKLEVIARAERYAQLAIQNEGNTFLKIEFVNDVPSHIGEIITHPVLGRLDSAENILANKVTAVLSRKGPKDLADIWGVCFKMGLSLKQAITDPRSKAAGVFPVDLAQVLLSASQTDWEVINWIEVHKVGDIVSFLHSLGEDLVII